MSEELGEVARVVNHLYGEKPKKPEEPEQDLGLELADLLYTMICLANDKGIDLQRSLEQVLEKYGGRDAARYPRAGDAAMRANSTGALTAARPRADMLRPGGKEVMLNG